MGSVPNPNDMQNQSNSERPENSDMELVKALANQEGVDAARLLESSGLMEELEELKANRADRRGRVLELMPFIAGELDTTDKMAKENLIRLAIEAYRKRVELAEKDDSGVVV